jgi:hypothetical protein
MSWSRPVEVRGPDLRLWRVGRRWSLWRPRFRKVRLDTNDAFNISGDVFDDVAASVAGLVIVLVVVVLAGPLGGVGVFVAEWALALLVIPLAVLYRIVFRRPWHVYAESADGRDALYARVAGWQASGDAIERAAAEIKTAGRPQSGRWVVAVAGAGD